MCGRYSLATIDPAAVRARFPVGESVEIRRRYNVAPGDDVVAVTADREGAPRVEMLRWGLVPPWANAPGAGPNLINARSETAAERPAFRGAFARMRCLILADGFFEWRMGAAGRKEAFHITRPGDGFFAFAGLWSVWHGPGSDGATLRSCAILTTAANDAVAPLHDRMPVILDQDAEDAWLDPGSAREELMSLLRPLAVTQTVLRAVGPAVNDARYDGPECLASAQPSAGQPALF